MEAKETINKQTLDNLRRKVTRFGMVYKFALEEIRTKVNILNEEFHLIHDYNPIEHVTTRVKSAESIIKKVQAKNLTFSLETIKEQIRDIAGIRITCSFVSDIYQISEMIQAQSDIKVIEVKDYIEHPKPTGYRSLHLVLSIPVFMSDRVEDVYVEMQIRTIAMDFWASLEHKIYYKYNKQVPEHLSSQLKKAADTVSELDEKMKHINDEINILKENDVPETEQLPFDPRILMLELQKHSNELDE